VIRTFSISTSSNKLIRVQFMKILKMYVPLLYYYISYKNIIPFIPDELIMNYIMIKTNNKLYDLKINLFYLIYVDALHETCICKVETGPILAAM